MQLALTFIIRACIIILNMHDKEKKNGTLYCIDFTTSGK